MSLITIDQLLESVDLDFEPRWITKDSDKAVWVWSGKPKNNTAVWSLDYPSNYTGRAIGKINVAEFAHKHWTECIYEVPRKVNYGKLVGKLCRFYDKTTDRRTYGLLAYRANGVFAVCGISSTFDCCEPVRPDDDVIYKDTVNELKRTSKLKCPFRQGYEKPLHYPCTVLMKAKRGCSYDKRLYCDIFSLYYKCEKEWDMGDLKDKIEWWCYATDLERYIKQSQKDLEIAKKALTDAKQTLFYCWDDYNIHPAKCTAEDVEKALKQIEHME